MVDEAPAGRRRRRRTGGFDAAEGDPGLTDLDDDFDDEDDDLNESVVDSVAAQAPLSEVDTDEATPDFTPRNRLQQVSARSSQYEREYRLKLVHRMIMRGVPLDEVANQLDVSVRTVQRDRQELFSRLREAAKKFDLNHFIGDMMGSFPESAMAMRAASNSKTPINHRLAAIRTASGARRDMTRMLDNAGVFDVVRYKPEKERGNADIRRLTDVARKLLGDEPVKQEDQSIARQIPESALFHPSVLDDDEEEEIHIL